MGNLAFNQTLRPTRWGFVLGLLLIAFWMLLWLGSLTELGRAARATVGRATLDRGGETAAEEPLRARF
jgi:hypothetical protein